jgi:hypothetical protein
MVCLGGSDGTSGVETVSLVNSATTTQTVYVLIDGWTTADFGSFEIQTVSTVIPPPAYTKTTIPQMCQWMTGSTQLLSSTTTPVISDDAVTNTIALPFPITFFGAAQTHFSVNNNGLMMVFPNSAGVGSNAYSNAAIPNNGAPNGLIAPFWDDLNSNATTVVHAVTTGTPPSRKFTIEWNNSQFLTSTRPERLTFQAQLYESTNVIEFHYCNLAANGGSTTDVSGAGATIGIESPTGADGVQHSNNTANSVNTTDAIRFTP